MASVNDPIIILENRIGIWKQINETQRHFNDIEIKLRNLALTLFTFIIGAVGFAAKEKMDITFIGNIEVPLASIIGVLGIVPLLGFLLMDRHWYHHFLVAAVEQGRAMEKKISENIPEVSLTEIIKKHSPTKFLGIEFHSKQKITLFYATLIFVLLITSIFSFFITSHKVIPIQYNYVKYNSVLLVEKDSTSVAPSLPGLIIQFTTDHSLIGVLDSKNISRSFLDFNIHSKNILYYFCVLMQSRDEVKNYILKNGITLVDDLNN